MRPLDHSSPESMASVIKAYIVLHNWMIDADEDDAMILDEFEDDAGFSFPDWMHIDNEGASTERRAGLDAKTKRDEELQFLFGDGI